MTSHTSKTTCPKCKSDDCNFTNISLGEAIVARINTHTTYCNACGYIQVSVAIANKQVFRETRSPEFPDETELEYMIHARERS